ncbi:hypothetical protein DV735_g1634, partial [Chaetothyriales sp. CBS 134920]
MPPEKKEKYRTIAEFFTFPRNKPPTFSPKSTVPQKRQPVAKPETKRNTTPQTPSKKRARQQAWSPTKAPPASPGTPLRQATLSFRSPAPTSSCPSTPSQARPPIDGQTELTARKQQQPSPSRSPTARVGNALNTTHNVVRDREAVVVVVSDSDDDSDSLVSLDELVGFKKKDDGDTDLSSPAELDEEGREKVRIKALSLFTQPRPAVRPGLQRLRELEAQEKSKSFNIAKYLDHEAELREQDQSLHETRVQYEAAKAQLEAERSGDAQKGLLESLMADDGRDENDVARLMNAVSRTEALSGEKTFSFFQTPDPRPPSAGSASPPEYPDTAIPMSLWISGDDDTRSRMFLSGLVAEFAGTGRLSDAALSWTFQAMATESDRHISSAYMECLRRASSWWTRTNLTAVDVQRCFQRLGANAQNVKSGSPIVASRHPLKERSVGEPPTLLLDLLELLQDLCLHMDFLALSTLASIVCRLAIDVDLMASSQLPGRVDSLLATLLDLPEREARLFVAEHILEDMGQNLQDPGLQTLFLSHILPVSKTASQVRLRLSHHFLLGGGEDTAATMPDSLSLAAPFAIDLPGLMNHVATDASFNTAQPTKLDFAALRARTVILDTAVADGGRPAVFATAADKASFNKSVDALAAVVKETFVKISDSGASHMSRSEAKDALQALYYRLMFAVRTEPQLKRNIFDPNTGKMRQASEFSDEQRGRHFMQGFLAKARHDKAPIQANLSTSSSSQDVSETERAIRRPLELSQ